MLVARALKNSQLTCGERHAYFGDRTLTHRSLFAEQHESELAKQANLLAENFAVPVQHKLAVVVRLSAFAVVSVMRLCSAPL
jgi:hypothetical protein